MKNVVLFLGICMVGFIQCTPQKKSNMQVFEDTYQVNLNACVEVMVEAGHDEDSARRLCDCMLRAAYEIDSTHVTLPPSDRDAFLNRHSAQIMERCRECGENGEKHE